MYGCWHTTYIHVYIYGYIENMTFWYTANGDTWTSQNLGANNDTSYFGRMWGRERVSNRFRVSQRNANAQWEFWNNEETSYVVSVHDTCTKIYMLIFIVKTSLSGNNIYITTKHLQCFGKSILRFLDVTKSIKIPPKNDWMPFLLLSGNY